MLSAMFPALLITASLLRSAGYLKNEVLGYIVFELAFATADMSIVLMYERAIW